MYKPLLCILMFLLHNLMANHRRKIQGNPKLSNIVTHLTGSNIRSKRQALIPFPRTGKRALNHGQYIPVHHSMGKYKRESALIPYPRTGKRAFRPRVGKRTPLPFFFANRNGWLIFFQFQLIRLILLPSCSFFFLLFVSFSDLFSFLLY